MPTLARLPADRGKQRRRLGRGTKRPVRQSGGRTEAKAHWEAVRERSGRGRGILGLWSLVLGIICRHRCATVFEARSKHAKDAQSPGAKNRGFRGAWIKGLGFTFKIAITE